MQGLWITLAWGLVALLAVSVLVALLEFLRQGTGPVAPAESPLPKARTLDVDLDAWDRDSPASPASPAAEVPRRAAQDVLHRLQQARASEPWAETTPTVLATRKTSDTASGNG